MNKIWRIYLPSVAITYTVTSLSVSIVNLLGGYELHRNSWNLEIFAFILVIELIDWCMGNIEFKTYRAYFLTEMVLTYIIMLLFSWWREWIIFDAIGITIITSLFLVIYTLIHLYFYKRTRREAAEINEMLKK